MGARRTAVLTATVGMLVGLLPLFPGAGTSAVAAEQSPGQQALAQAAESGEPVEVIGERTEYSTVLANPDGETFTLRASVSPQRVATASGGWAAPDPTLVRGQDGRIAPRAAATGIEFSNGGGREVAKISEGGAFPLR